MLGKALGTRAQRHTWEENRRPRVGTSGKRVRDKNGLKVGVKCSYSGLIS